MKGLRCCANGTRPVKCTFRFSFSHFRARRGGPTLGLARKWSLSKPAIRSEICAQSFSSGFAFVLPRQVVLDELLKDVEPAQRMAEDLQAKAKSLLSGEALSLEAAEAIGAEAP